MMSVAQLEEISAELCRIEELVAALDLASDALERGQTPQSAMAHDATFGVIRALKLQISHSHQKLDLMFADARVANSTKTNN